MCKLSVTRLYLAENAGVICLVKNYTYSPFKHTSPPPSASSPELSVQTNFAYVLTDILLEPDDKLSSYHSLQSSDTDLETIVEHNVDTGIWNYDETESEEEYAQEEDQEEDQDDLSAHALSNSSPMSSVLSDIETSIDIDAIDEDYTNGDEYREDYEAGK